jgi:hypothetical protein
MKTKKAKTKEKNKSIFCPLISFEDGKVIFIETQTKTKNHLETAKKISKDTKNNSQTQEKRRCAEKSPVWCFVIDFAVVTTYLWLDTIANEEHLHSRIRELMAWWLWLCLWLMLSSLVFPTIDLMIYFRSRVTKASSDVHAGTLT